MSFGASDLSVAFSPGTREAVRAASGDPTAALRLAPDVAREVAAAEATGSDARHGDGVRNRWEALAWLGSVDLTVARALEPHLDALAILDQAGVPAGDEAATWGVFAAEGPGTRLEASDDGSRWTLDGRKPWCSLAETLSNALVTAWVSPSERGLFAVSLGAPGVSVAPGTWVARGLSDVRTVPLDFEAVPATPVGAPGWYLTRPGFALGGVGVAAIWWGAAAALARQLAESTRRREPDPLTLLQLGRCEVALHAAAAALGAEADTPERDAAQAWPRALRVRAVVHDACEQVIAAVTHALGAGPMTQDEEFARRVADLQVYLRQHKPEADTAALGRSVRDGLSAAWSGL